MMGMPLSQRQTNYKTVSPDPGDRQCANCRWFEWSNYNSPEMMTPISGCHLIESYPLPILPTGLCDRWEENIPEAYEPEPMPVIVVEEERAFTPPSLGVKQRLTRRLQGKPMPASQIVGKSGGQRIGIIVSTNGYMDRELEHVSKDAVTAYIDSCWKENVWAGEDVMMLWHYRPLGAVGDVLWSGEIDGFIHDVVRERDHLIAKTVWDYWESHPELDWGASIGFKPLAVNDNVYTQIERKEVSILPRSNAANPLTYSGVVKMAELNKSGDRARLLDEIFKIEGVADLLATRGVHALNEELTKRGVTAKENETLDTAGGSAVPAAKAPDYDALMASLIEGMASLQATLETQGGQLTTVTDQLQAERGKREVLEGDLKATKALAEKELQTLRDEMALTPRRAVEIKGVEVGADEAAKLAAQKAQAEATPHPVFGTLVDMSKVPKS